MERLYDCPQKKSGVLKANTDKKTEFNVGYILYFKLIFSSFYYYFV